MKKTIILVLMLWVTQQIYAQNLSKTGVLRMQLRNSGSIIQDGAVKGYYFFYNQEKKDSKNSNYLLSVYDENLREINSTNIVRPTTYALIEGVFNGGAFGFLFYDSKSKSLELIGYDQTLKQTGTVKKMVGNKYARAIYNQIALGNDPVQAYLVPITGKGFICYGIKEGKDLQYEIEFYNNSMVKKWSNQSTAAGEIEQATEAYQDEVYVGSLIGKRKNMTSRDIEFDLQIQNVQDGNVLFRMPMVTDKHSVSFSDVYFDQEKQTFVVFGEYYAKGDKELKDQSLGFMTLQLDLKGKIVGQKINSWATEISRVTPMNEKGKFEGLKANILFHRTLRTKDGQIFVIGEQYKKVVSGAGVASQILGGSSSQVAAFQINVYNMVIFQFNPDFSINKVHLFEKDKNVVMLPAGFGYVSSKLLSYYAKSVGGFDYAFSQISKDKNTFLATYINYDKEKGQKAQNVLGSIVYTPEKTFVTDKLVLNRKSTNYYIHKAKDGYILVVEYFKKEKRLDSRLEKINY